MILFDIIDIITSTKEHVLSHVSVCLLVNRMTQKPLNRFPWRMSLSPEKTPLTTVVDPVKGKNPRILSMIPQGCCIWTRVPLGPPRGTLPTYVSQTTYIYILSLNCLLVSFLFSLLISFVLCVLFHIHGVEEFETVPWPAQFSSWINFFFLYPNFWTVQIVDSPVIGEFGQYKWNWLKKWLLMLWWDTIWWWDSMRNKMTEEKRESSSLLTTGMCLWGQPEHSQHVCW